jgi:hypothetical protein
MFTYYCVFQKGLCDCNIVYVGLLENGDIECAILIVVLYSINSNAYQSHVICQSYSCLRVNKDSLTCKIA